jgi:hypothetical protein
MRKARVPPSPPLQLCPLLQVLLLLLQKLLRPAAESKQSLRFSFCVVLQVSELVALISDNNSKRALPACQRQALCVHECKPIDCFLPVATIFFSAGS